MTDCKARIAGPASEAIRNTVAQTLTLAAQGKLSLMQLQLAAGVLEDCAEQVERLEAMAVPDSQRADPRDIESGKVVLLPFILRTGSLYCRQLNRRVFDLSHATYFDCCPHRDGSGHTCCGR